MTRTRYGVSPWIDGVPAAKRPQYPAYRGASSSSVVIIGGGMTGCMTAYACAAAGLKVVLLEADRVGHGGSGRAAGVFTSEGAESFKALEARVGRRVARAIFSASLAAPRELAATVKRLGIRAGLELRPAMRVLPADTPDKALRREAAERAEAEVRASWLKPAAIAKQAGLPSAGGMLMPDWGFANPYRLAIGFAAAAVKRGAVCFERSMVTRTRFDRRRAEVVLERGTVTTDTVIVCTGEPTPLFKPLRRHFHYDDRYAVMTEPLPASVRAAVGLRLEVLTDVESPAHQLWWTADDRVVFSGADQRRPAPRLREQTLVQRTGQLMYELSRLYPDISGTAPSHGWDVPMARSGDESLYAGAHRHFPRHLFGLSTGHDAARAFLASRILVRCLLGRPTREDEFFGFSRAV